MANDIKVVYNNITQEFNFVLKRGDLERESGLLTAVLMSLFTDRRADDEDELINDNDKCGWWGDELEDNDRIGSKLWLLNRAKTTTEVVELAEQYTREALEWMTEDGVAVKIETEAERQGSYPNDILALGVKIYYQDGNTFALKFKNLWEVQVDAF